MTDANGKTLLSRQIRYNLLMLSPQVAMHQCDCYTVDSLLLQVF